MTIRQVESSELPMPIDRGDIEAAVAGLRADGPHVVKLRFPQKFIGMHLREIAQFLVEWRMPHTIRLLPEQSDEVCILELRFPNEKHAYAFERQFVEYLNINPIRN